MNKPLSKNKIDSDKMSRRNFMKCSAAVSLAALGTGASRIYADGSDKMRVGLIGCGNRGTAAAINCIDSADGVEIVAMGDLFKDRLDKSLESLRTKKPQQMKVTEEMCFVGFDAYKKVVGSDVDLVILATPPHFRPEHLKAAVEAGKHVFMEKPVAVDPVGVRSVISSSELADEKKLGIVAGTQRRHCALYVEIMKRIHNGDIGDIMAAQCYFNWGKGGGAPAKKPGMSDMEWQIRRWYGFNWLSGDHIVEQAVHSLDVINWAMNSHPISCLGVGGREVRSGHGNIYDHFAVEYEYPNGVRMLHMCQQIPKCTDRISERVVGTKGIAYTWGVAGDDGHIKGENPFKYDGDWRNPYEQEHVDLINSIRKGRPINEGRQIAESTMTAIIGRMSTYTGRELSWKWAMNASKLDLSPPKYEFGDLPVRPVAIPGKTPLV
ncbi:MAG: Gfo/Idh/MocA family oxidoreductase [Planctomycetota bacterium]|jgi:predicted dehydrogenase